VRDEREKSVAAAAAAAAASLALGSKSRQTQAVAPREIPPVVASEDDVNVLRSIAKRRADAAARVADRATRALLQLSLPLAQSAPPSTSSSFSASNAFCSIAQQSSTPPAPLGRSLVPYAIHAALARRSRGASECADTEDRVEKLLAMRQFSSDCEPKKRKRAVGSSSATAASSTGADASTRFSSSRSTVAACTEFQPFMQPDEAQNLGYRASQPGANLRSLLPQAPIFRPTVEEFSCAMAYLDTVVRPVGERYGIVRLVPPPGASLPASLDQIDRHAFRFPTKLQPLHMLALRDDAPAERFVARLAMWYRTPVPERDDDALGLAGGRGERLAIELDKCNADLRALLRTVLDMGGFEAVTEAHAWREVGQAAGLVEPEHRARQLYRSFLLPVETCARTSPGEPATFARALAILDAVRVAAPATTATTPDQSSFGYQDGGDWSLPAFEAMASAEVAALFPDLPEGAMPSAAELESLFWDTIEKGNRRLFARYGNDLSVLEANRKSLQKEHCYRSVFPTTRRNPASHHQFNLNVLPRAPGSLLGHLPTRIPGVTDPMVYVGSALSTFAWHAEDNLLCSANYMHHGAPKLWYGVPCASHEAFEDVFRRRFAKVGGQGLIFDLITQLSPIDLLQAGVPVCTTIQEEGEFVITFSGAFHAGFNLGFNVAEAVNFAPPSWIPVGRVSLAKYHRAGENRESVFSLDNAVHATAIEFVRKVETKDRPIAELRIMVRLGRAVATELESMVRSEANVRAQLRREGVTHISAVPTYQNRDADAEDDIIQCCVCKRDSFLSAVVCPCTLAKLACPAHHGALCNCAPSEKRHLIRYSQEYLEGLLAKMEESLRSLVSILNAT